MREPERTFRRAPDGLGTFRTRDGLSRIRPPSLALFRMPLRRDIVVPWRPRSTGSVQREILLVSQTRCQHFLGYETGKSVCSKLKSDHWLERQNDRFAGRRFEHRIAQYREFVHPHDTPKQHASGGNQPCKMRLRHADGSHSDRTRGSAGPQPG
jgi:hypothetical protein